MYFCLNNLTILSFLAHLLAVLYFCQKFITATPGRNKELPVSDQFSGGRFFVTCSKFYIF